MKRVGLTIGAIVGAVILIWSFGFNARAAGDPKAEITDIEHKVIAATTADQLMPYYDAKEIVFYDFVPGLQYVGEKAVHDDVDNFFKNATDLEGTIADLRVETDGTLAVAHSLQHVTWKDKQGTPKEMTFRVTDCYHKVNGQWKIFHMHASVPVDPVTGKGEMNLKK